MSYSGPLEDRLMIRELIETYNDAVFRRDANDWKDTWASDSEWQIFGQVIKGRANILKMWEGAMASLSYVGFFAIPGMINVTEKTAISRVYIRETLVQDGQLRMLGGRYIDDLIKVDNMWRFKCRRYEIIFDSDALT